MQKLGLVFGLCVAVTACGGSSVNRGGLGESCTSRDDCSGNLVCYNNVCSQSVGAPSAADGGGVTTPLPVLGGAGESCTRRADCSDGLRCFAGICAASEPAPVDAGPQPPSNPVLSDRGETCTTSSDCTAGLICLPSLGTSGLGICDVEKYDLAPGANSCHAECKTDLDCCELPLGLAATPIDGGPATYNSCADLLKAMAPFIGSNCNDHPAISHECFLYKTYCDCSASNKPWKCSTEMRCVYNKPCDPTVTGEVMKGCPAKTRASFPVSSCNNLTKTCAAGGPAGCTMNDDCTGQPVADHPREACAPGECACVIASGSCYRKCDAELDCRAGYTCDTTQALCKPAGQCTTDAFCAVALHDATAKCVAAAGGTAKTCKIPCRTDQDCSPSGLGGTSFTGSVCGADKFCGSMGCSKDDECSLLITGDDDTPLGSIKMFCAPSAAGTGIEWTSAITD